ncbi:MAG: GNAT family N-acetyltransferase [Anaerolineae bacterium]|jgi:RimJ/RimL family protein N-acetyltransferase|nr:GNAT family N-acetyltransferase [Anaerolineae bacterium]
MFCELTPKEYVLAAPLFAGRFSYSCSIRALLAGNSSGRIFVDQVPKPTWAMAFTVEGVLLTGDPQESQVLESLKAFFTDEIFSGKLFGDDDDLITICVDPPDWSEKLHQIIPDREPVPIPRQNYVCRELKYDYRQHLLEGYTINVGPSSQLTGGPFIVHQEVADWIDRQEEWGKETIRADHDLQAAAIVKDGEIIAWSGVDCTDGEWLDCGIYTVSAHRKKGLAAAAVSALVEWAFNNGYRRIGWHCDDINHGSAKTAQKVGFKLEQEYIYYSYQVNLANHLAELGWFHFQRGNHEKTRECYEEVFALRDENPHYFYHLAALCWGEMNDEEKALAYLEKAAFYGWSAAEYTAGREEFAFLKETPRFNALIERMRNNES